MCGEGRSPCSPTLLSLLRQLMKMALWEFITDLTFLIVFLNHRKSGVCFKVMRVDLNYMFKLSFVQMIVKW